MVFKINHHHKVACLLHHTSAEGHLGYEKCLHGSVNGFWALLLGYFENQLYKKYCLGASSEFFFFILGGLKNFFYLKKLYLALETLNLGEGGGLNILIQAMI